MVFAPFRSGTGVDHSLPIFVLNRVWFTRATGVYGRICRFNSKWIKKKEEHANPKWMLGNLFFWVLVWKWWLNFYPYQIWKRNWIQEAWVRTVVENNIFQSETGPGLEEPGCTATPKIPGNTFPDKQAVDLWISLGRGIVFVDFFVRVT